jgi:hypothetical protein
MSETFAAVGEVKFDREQQLTVFRGCNGPIMNRLIMQSEEPNAPLHFAGVPDVANYLDEGWGRIIYPLADVDGSGQIQRVHGVVDFLVKPWPIGRYESEFVAGDFRRQKQSLPLEDSMQVHMYEGARLVPICRGLAAAAIRNYSEYRMLSQTYTGIYAEVAHDDVVTQEALLHLVDTGIGFKPVGSSHDGQTQAFSATLDELDQMLHLRGQNNPE